MVRGAAAAGIAHFIHVSSLAVLAQGHGGPIGDHHPLEPNSKGSGPYVWGKLESERRAVDLGEELGLSVKVIRPGALVDYRDFDPPGRLGKRLGNFFVAVGSSSDRLGVVDVGFAGRFLAWMTDMWESVPGLNLLDPVSDQTRVVDHLQKPTRISRSSGSRPSPMPLVGGDNLAKILHSANLRLMWPVFSGYMTPQLSPYWQNAWMA
jgi:hypothetical protein